MPRPSMMPTLLRELIVARTLPREPEPDLVMDGPEQVAAYEEAGRIDSVMSAAYLFHTARISQVISGAKTVLDLGCGPAVQLAQVAQFNPNAQFRGIDLSTTMLSQGRAHLATQALSNVTLEHGDITQLSSVETASVDAVISTMALHHLPRAELLTACFKEIARVIKPGGAVYITDFGRLKSLKSVIYFAYMNEPRFPHLHLFWLDYERSLRAAFLASELKTLAAQYLPEGVQHFKTFGVPLLNVLQTAAKPASPELRSQFKALRARLPWRYRMDIDDMRLFFKMGGLAHDPF